MTAAVGLFAIAPSVFAADAEPELLDTSRYFHRSYRLTTLRGRVTGVFRDDVDAAFVFVALNCAGRREYAYACSKDADRLLERLAALHGRDVTITGVETPASDRVVVGHMVLIRSLADISTADENMPDPFNVADLADSPPPQDELAAPSPRKTCGTVDARWPKGRVMLRGRAGESRIVEFRDGIAPPKQGEFVEVAGIPVSDLYRIHLVDACWRKVADPPKQEAVPAAEIAIKSLFRHPSPGVVGDRFIMNPAYYGKPVTVKGTMRELVIGESGGRLLLLEDEGFTVQVDCGDAPGALERVRKGSRASATGICVIDSDFWRPDMPFPKNKRLFLVARSEDDVVVIADPPWWTPFRFACAVAVLSGLLALAAAWNASLRAMVARKSREVLKANRRKLESEFRVGERTRLAADLHDSLSQNLTVIGYQVSAAKNTLAGKDPETAKCLDIAAKMIHSCRTDLRRCLWDLRNDVLNEPDFAEAMRRTIAPVAGGASVSIQFSGPRTAISDSTAHGVLCIVRELVANAVSHGRAKSVRIDGEVVRTGLLRISVQDDGCGFDVASRPGQDEGHFGLDGIAERIERMEGSFELNSAPGKGTRALISIRRPPAEGPASPTRKTADP